MEVIQRCSEEFFDLDADIRHLPRDAESLAQDLADNLERPELLQLEQLFGDFPNDPGLEGIAFLIDAWQDEESLRMGAEIVYYVFMDFRLMFDDEGESLTNHLLDDMEQLFESDKAGNFKMSGIYVNTPPESLDSIVPDLIRSVFTRQDGPFGFAFRDKEEPPSWFVLAKMERLLPRNLYR